MKIVVEKPGNSRLAGHFVLSNPINNSWKQSVVPTNQHNATQSNLNTLYIYIHICT